MKCSNQAEGITIETFLEHLEGKHLPFANLLERQLLDGENIAKTNGEMKPFRPKRRWIYSSIFLRKAWAEQRIDKAYLCE